MTGQGKLKVAVIGTGGWGREHARVFSQRADVVLVAVVGRRIEKAQPIATEFKTRAYEDLSHMLAQERPDFAGVALPNLAHFSPTLQLIEAGVPILVEKPLVFELGEADTLLAEAARRKLFFAINFNHRYAKPIQLAREAIEKRRLGEIVHATWRFGGEASSSDHRYANLIETQCHGFDQLEFLCGPISSVSAEMTELPGRGCNTLVVALRFRNGAVGSLLGTYDSSYSYRDAHRLEINGNQGRIVVSDTVRQFSFQTAGEETAEVWEAGYFNDRDREFIHTFDRHVEAMLTAFKRGEPPPIHATAGRRALELAWAVVRSFEEGRRVAV